MSFLADAWPLTAVATDEFNFKEEGKKKVLCVSAVYQSKIRRWFTIDPRSNENREIMSTRCERGHELETVRAPTVAVVESEIYVIGGLDSSTVYMGERREVFVHNIKRCEWKEAPSLNHRRASSFVFASGRKIYVFGTRFHPPNTYSIPLEDWVECYDLDSPDSGWKTYPAPDDDRFFSGPLYAGVLYQNEIRFWGDYATGIFAFNLSSNTWSFTSFQFSPDQPKPCFNFMSNHVVLGHLVLWQYRGTLYSWDLTHNSTKELCTLKGVYFLPPDPDDYISRYPGPTKLLHLGHGLLCLLRWSKSVISCYPFQIESLPGGELQVQPRHPQFYKIPGCAIEHATVLFEDCMESAEAAEWIRKVSGIFSELKIAWRGNEDASVAKIEQLPSSQSMVG